MGIRAARRRFTAECERCIAFSPKIKAHANDEFFAWYNDEHYHSGIGLLTPTSLHFGQAEEIITARGQTLESAWEKTPERFVGGVPKAMSIPKAVWINEPKRGVAKKNGAPEETSLTHPRSSYPLEGCVSAEPSSVSPDNDTIPSNQSLNTPSDALQSRFSQNHLPSDQERKL